MNLLTENNSYDGDLPRNKNKKMHEDTFCRRILSCDSTENGIIVPKKKRKIYSNVLFPYCLGKRDLILCLCVYVCMCAKADYSLLNNHLSWA